MISIYRCLFENKTKELLKKHKGKIGVGLGALIGHKLKKSARTEFEKNNVPTTVGISKLNQMLKTEEDKRDQVLRLWHPVYKTYKRLNEYE